jgi:hypothetical protein
MKIYVWDDFGCDYTCGIAVCIASSLEEAFEIIEKQLEEDENSFMLSSVYFGKPTRILDVEPSLFYATGGG